MARGHGRILSSIWEDTDFLDLTPQQQRLYLFLISQPNLNHAGLLPLTLRRWARKAAGLTAADLEKDLHLLADAQFIVLDDDSEELLIRSFVRNDGVWKQPKVMGAMVAGAMEIESHQLRRALLAEMDRIPVDDLSDEPTKTRSGPGPSIREQVVEHIEALRKAFGGPDTTPSGRGSVTPSGTPSDTPPQGGREGSTRAHACAQTRAAPAPAPTPAPLPSPGPTPSAGAPARDEPLPDRMLSAWWEKYGRATAQGKKAIRATVAEALDNGLNPDELWSALCRLGDTSKPVTGGTLQFALSEVRKPAKVIDLSSRQQQASDDMFDRAMARAEARMQRKESS
ncbi:MULTISPECIES: hypothetical protein [Streptomyces]|uniref:hypothetical protein n=1 Tax=Streptomyces TaxID=1883 RepID=UPI00345B97ED